MAGTRAGRVGAPIESALRAVGAAWVGATQAGVALPFGWCLVFGALISPTDPVAVLGILKSARVPTALGNDGRKLVQRWRGHRHFQAGIGPLFHINRIARVAGNSIGVSNTVPYRETR